MKQTSIFVTIMIFSSAILAWEPYRADVTLQKMAESSEGYDHLLVLDHTEEIKRLGYIAMYVSRPSFDESSHLAVYRDDESGKYSISTWKETPNHIKKQELIPDSAIEIEIPESTAVLIYDIWVNALLVVRYPRSSYIILDGTRSLFSTFVTGIGYLDGATSSPELELPPKWMTETGDYLFEMSRRAKANPKGWENELNRHRVRLFDYLRKNGKH